jgi:allantoate deiminase
MIKRFCLTDEMDQCHKILEERFKSFFIIEKDRVGNILFKCKRYDKTKPTLLFGSHLDTVENAGMYDGVLGVVIGLIIGQNFSGHKFNIDVVGFSDEEGGRFGCRFIGSLNFIGELPEDYLEACDNTGLKLREVISRKSFSLFENFEGYLSERQPIFLEPHIEQGTVLEDRKKSIGIVKCISGQSLAKITFKGKTAHAVNKWGRQDSLASAADFIAQSNSLHSSIKDAHITVGKILNYPNLSNVVSSETSLQMDIRHTSNEVRIDLLDKIAKLAKGIASIRGVGSSIENLDRLSGIMDEEINATIEEIAMSNNVEYMKLNSYAGHDSTIMATKVPSCLIFLRDRKGISHHPDESMEIGDLAEGFRFFCSLVSGNIREDVHK